MLLEKLAACERSMRRTERRFQRKKREKFRFPSLNILFLQCWKKGLVFLILLTKDPAKSFSILAGQNRDGTFIHSFVEHRRWFHRIRLWSLGGGFALGVATLVLSVLLNTVFRQPASFSFAASYSWIIPSDVGFGWTDHRSPTRHTDIPDENPDNLSVQGNALRLSAKSTRLRQSNWVGGPGQLSLIDPTKFYASTNIDYATANQIKLSIPTTTFADDFSTRSAIDSSATTTVVERTRDGNRARVDVELEAIKYRGGGNVMDVTVRNASNNEIWGVVDHFILKKDANGYDEPDYSLLSNDYGTFTTITSSDADRKWAGTTTGHLFQTTSGSNWSLVQNGENPVQPCGANVALNDLSAIVEASCGASCDVWVACNDGNAAVSTDSGATWTKRAVSTWSTVRSIASVSATQAFAVSGQNTQVKTTSNSGSSWTDSDTGSSENLYGVFAASASAAVAVGANGTIRAYNGTGWISQTSGVSTTLLGVHAFNASNIWAVGASGTILQTSNAGSTWNNRTNTSVTSNTLNAVRVFSSTKAALVGNGGDMIEATSSGATLSEKFPNTDSTANQAASFANRNVGWIAGDSGKLLYTSTGGTGAGWGAQGSSCGVTANITDVSAVKNADCALNCVAWVACSDGAVAFTLSSGSTWAAVTAPPTTLTTIAAINSTTAFGADASGNLYKFSNNAWSSNKNPTSNRIRQLSAASSSAIWGVGDNNTIVFSSDGTSFSSQTSPVASSAMLTDVDAIQSQVAAISSSAGKVLTTSDGGTTWSAVTVDSGLPQLLAIGAWSDRVMTVAEGAPGSPGTRWFQTSDGGTTWSATTFAGNVVDVEALDEKTVLYIGGTNGLLAERIALFKSSGIVQSTAADTVSSTITKATLTPTGSLNNQTATYQLSANGGTNWEAVSAGTEYTFTNTGSDLRWRAILNHNSGSAYPPAYLTNVSLAYVAGYAESGNLTSSIFDFGTTNTEFKTGAGSATMNGQTVTVRVRTGKKSDLSDALKSNIADCDVVAWGIDLSNKSCVRDGDRYGQLYLSLATSAPNTSTPVVTAVEVQSLLFGSLFQDFDAQSTATWDQFLPNEAAESSEINMKYRFKTGDTQEALEQATWSAFFDDASFSLSALSPSRWLRVESRIETTDVDNADDGDLQGFELRRQQNGAPEFHSTYNDGKPLIAQGSDGKVSITVKVRDPDTSAASPQNRKKMDLTFWVDRGIRLSNDLPLEANTLSVVSSVGLPQAGTLLIDREVLTYNGIDGNQLSRLSRGQRSTSAAVHASNSGTAVVWMKMETIDGEGLVNVDQTEFSEVTALWDAPKDYAGAFSSTTPILAFANDREPVYNTAVQTTTANIDTKPPVVTAQSIEINNGASKTNDRSVTLQLTATDDSSIVMAFSNNGTIFGTQTDESGRVTNAGTFRSMNKTTQWKLAVGDDGPKEVTVLFKDSVGNVSEKRSDTIILDTNATSIVRHFSATDASQPAADRFWALLGWSPLSGEKNPDFDHYLIERSTDSVNFSKRATIADVKTDFYLDQELSAKKLYSFRIRGVDDAGNESDPSTIIAIAPGATDSDPPKILGEPGLSQVTGKSSQISWKTDEASDSCVEYGETNDFGRTECVRIWTKDHDVRLAELKPSVVYTYRVISTDIFGHEVVSETRTFTTKSTGEDVVPPEILLPGPTVESGFTDALVQWETNEHSDSFVEFGPATSYGSVQGSVAMTKNHRVTIVGLTPLIQTHYRIRSRDAEGNEVVSKDEVFITKAVPGKVAPPAISGIEIIAPEQSNTSAIVRWKTTTHSTSSLRYGALLSNLDRETAVDPQLNLDHVVTLDGLAEGTTTYFKVLSADAFGQTSISDVQSLTTTRPIATPAISDVAIGDITLDSFLISWTTTATTSTIVHVGLGDEALKPIVEESGSLTTQHVVRVRDLKEGQQYRVRLSGTNHEGRTVVSDEYFVRTRSLPSIEGLGIDAITASTARVRWKTSEATDSIVSFGPKGESRFEQGFSELVQDHDVTITGLRPQTTYALVVKSRDMTGREAVSEEQTFETPQDGIAPVLSDIQQETNLIGAGEDAEIRLIISWRTDEPSTSQVQTSKGLVLSRDRSGNGRYPDQTPLDDLLTTNHVVLLTVDPAATYHFRVGSTDAALNSSFSDDFTALTPTQRITILERVLGTLTNTFSWVTRLRSLAPNSSFSSP